jgi:hypothetical protein
MVEFARMIENDYSIKRKGTTVQNPQANTILEQVHQTIDNILWIFSDIICFIITETVANKQTINQL